MSLQHKKLEKTTSRTTRRQYGIKNYFYSDSITRPRKYVNKYVILRHLGDMCLFTSALRASVNKSHIPEVPQNNRYLFPPFCPQPLYNIPLLISPHSMQKCCKGTSSQCTLYLAPILKHSTTVLQNMNTIKHCTFKSTFKNCHLLLLKAIIWMSCFLSTFSS
jgi:hypothetical protein